MNQFGNFNQNQLGSGGQQAPAFGGFAAFQNFQSQPNQQQQKPSFHQNQKPFQKQQQQNPQQNKQNQFFGQNQQQQQMGGGFQNKQGNKFQKGPKNKFPGAPQQQQQQNFQTQQFQQQQQFPKQSFQQQNQSFSQPSQQQQQPFGNKKQFQQKAQSQKPFYKKEVPGFLQKKDDNMMDDDNSNFNSQSIKVQAKKSLPPQKQFQMFAQPSSQGMKTQSQNSIKNYNQSQSQMSQGSQKSQIYKKQIPAALQHGFVGSQPIQIVNVQKQSPGNLSQGSYKNKQSNQPMADKKRQLGDKSQKPSFPSSQSSKESQKKFQSAQKPQSKTQAKNQLPKQKQFEQEEPEYQEGEEDYYDDEYYDDEYYGEEDYGEEEKKSPNQKEEQFSSKIPCKNFALGQCKFGEKCKFSHDLKSTPPKIQNKTQTPCWYFLTNSCTKGDKCEFSHDEKIKDMMKQIQIEGKNPAEIKTMITQLLNKSQNIVDQNDEEYDDEEYDEELEEEYDEEQEEPQETKMPKLDEIAEQNKKKNLNMLLNKPTVTVPIEQPVNQQKRVEEKKTLSSLPPLAKKPSLTIKPKKTLEKPTLQIQPKAPQIQQEEIKEQKPSINVDPSDLKGKRDMLLKEFDDIRKNAGQYLIPGKAELLGMCSEQELIQRGSVEVSSANAFEKDSEGRNFERLAIKAFERSAADKVMNDPKNIRPPEVLYKTVEYLRECIVDLDYLQPGKSIYLNQRASFMDVYSFVRDRGRCVANDFSIINDPDNEYYINVSYKDPNNLIQSLEELGRFMISSIHEGFLHRDYNHKQNLDILNGFIVALMKCYSTIREKSCSNAQATTTDLLQKLDFSNFNDNDKSLLKEAISINLSVQAKNCIRYFKLIRNTNYMFACLSLLFLNQQRMDLLDIIGYGTRAFNFPLSLMRKSLMFKSIQQLESFIEACGFMKDENGEFNHRNRAEEYNVSFLRWSQSERLDLLDQLKDKQTRCLIMRYGITQEQLQKNTEAAQKIKEKQKEFEQQLKQKEIEDQKKKVQLELKKKQELQKQKEEQEKLEKQKLEEQKLQDEKERKIKEQKEKEERERYEKLRKEREEKERVERERLEKERQERLKREKEMMIQKRYKDISRKLELRKVTQLKIKEVMQFFKEYKSLLGKRKERDFQHEIEVQLIELFEEEAVIPQESREKMYQTIQKYDYDLSQLSVFTITKWIDKILKDQQGELKIRLVSSTVKPKLTQDTQLYDILQCLVMIMNNTFEKEIKRQQMLKQYETQINSKLVYSFKYLEIEKLQKTNSSFSSLLGSNLIMLLTTKQTIDHDIAYFKKLMEQFPEYSRFNFLILGFDQSNETLNRMETKIIAQFSDELNNEKIGHLSFCKLCFHSHPSKPKKIKQINYPYNLRNLILAFILDDLTSSIENCQVINAKETFTAHNLKTVLDKCKLDLDPILIDNDYQEIQCQETYFKKFFLDLKAAKANIYDLQLANEFQVLNFWLLVLQQMIEPVYDCIKDSIEYYRLRDDNENIKDMLPILVQGLHFIVSVYHLELFDYPLIKNLRYNSRHVKYLVQERIDDLYADNKIKEQILSQINGILRFQSVPPLSKNRSKFIFQMNIYIGYYKGTVFFQIIFKPFFQYFNEKLFTLIKPKTIKSYQDIDYQEIERQMEEQNFRNNDTFERLVEKFPLDFKEEGDPHPFYVKFQERVNKTLLKKRKKRKYYDLAKEIQNITNDQQSFDISCALELQNAVNEQNQVHEDQLVFYIELEEDNMLLNKRQKYDTNISTDKNKILRQFGDFNADIDDNKDFIEQMRNELQNVSTDDSNY